MDVSRGRDGELNVWGLRKQFKKMAKALTRKGHTFMKITRCFSLQPPLSKASDLIPSQPVWEHTDESELPPPTKIPISTAKHLEQLSLVNFEDMNAVKRLESAIRFADQILLVDTEGVEPLISVLEDIELPMRSDDVTETNSSIVNLAEEVFEGYYIAPAGNIVYTGEDIPDTKVLKKSETGK